MPSGSRAKKESGPSHNAREIKQANGHASQFGKRVFAPLSHAVNQNLRVRLGGKAVTAERQPPRRSDSCTARH